MHASHCPKFLQPCVSSALRFFSASKVGYESPKDALSAEDKKRREQSRQWEDIPGFKSNVDPEYRRDLRKIVAAANRRYYRNPDHREKLMAKSKTTNALYRAEPDLYIKQRLRVWLHTSAWARDELDWKAHKPVWSAVKVSRTCESCQIERLNGAHLWWSRIILHTRNMLILFLGGYQRKYDPSLFDCMHCYLGSDPRQAYPKGCEDVTSLPELRRRKQELDLGMKPGSLSQNMPSAVEDIQS